MLRFAEEIILLLLDETHGELAPNLSPYSLNIVLAGAVLMDLALEDRIDTDLENLMLVDATPVDDDLLDPTLADIARESDMHDIDFWIVFTVTRGREIRERALARLVAQGILESETGGQIFLSRSVSHARRYPARDGKAVEEVQLRIMRVLFSDELPDPRDIVIICLADACGVFESILSKSDLNDVRERIDQIKKLDLIGQAITRAIRQFESQSSRASRQPIREIPQVRGLPLVGNAFSMADLGTFLMEQYRNLGPVFRIRAFNRRFVVLIGAEANLFAAQGNRYFRNHEPWLDFMTAQRMNRFIVGMDGSEHIRLRREFAKAFSPKLAENRVIEVADIARRVISTWTMDKPIPGMYACQCMIIDQLGTLAINTSPEEYTDDIIYFFHTMLSVYISRHYPKLMTRLPRFRRARKQVQELRQNILATYKLQKRGNDSSHYVNSLFELNRTDPHLVPEPDLFFYMVAPFLVGLDTAAGVCAFMLYELLKHPDLLEQMTAEADAFFASDPRTLRDVRQLDITRRTAMETMRLYPIAPVLSRTVANSFEFAGFTIPAGEQVLIAFSAPHKMAEYFPDPEHFDIDRYTRERAEHRHPGVYMPFGFGAHECLGRSLSEVLIAVNMASIVHETELVLDPPNYKMKVKQLPQIHPDKSFKFRLVRRRKRT